MSVSGALSIQKIFKPHMALQRKIFIQFSAYCRVFIGGDIYLVKICVDYTVRIQSLAIFSRKIVEDIPESLVEGFEVSEPAVHHYLSNCLVSCAKLK